MDRLLGVTVPEPTPARQEVIPAGPITTEKREKAEHVSGIVLQPLWRIHKLDWTVRKNVFEKSSNTSSALLATPPTTDDRTHRELRHPLAFSADNQHKETAYGPQHELVGRGREKHAVPHRYRPSYNRKRWNCDLVRKPPTP